MSRVPIRGRATHPRRGVALMFVLGIIALLSVLTTLLVLSLKTRLVEQSQRELAAELRDAARSAIEAKLAELAEYRAAEGSVYGPGQGWGGLSADTTRYAERHGLTLQVAVTDESARLPLNTGDVTWLTRIFIRLEIPDAAAERLAAALADWTDADDTVRPGGAEKDAYPAGAGPANRALVRTEEIFRITGFPEWFADATGTPNDRFARLDSLVSVDAVSDRPNVNGASDAVLEFVARDFGLEGSRLREIRDTQTPRGVFRDPAEMASGGVPAALAARVSLVPSLLRLRATAARGEVARQVEVLVRLHAGAPQVLRESESSTGDPAQ